MCRWRATCSRLRTQALSSGSGPHVRQIDERSADLAIGNAHKILDLSGVTLVDVEVVRFLIRCDEEGIEIAIAPRMFANGCSERVPREDRSDLRILPDGFIWN